MSTALNVINNFVKNDFILLGTGAYAAVFASKTDLDKVYKIGITTNDPFLDYIANFKDTDNPHFPKVKDVYVDYDNDWYMLSMEKLSVLPVNRYDECDALTSILTTDSSVNIETKLEELVVWLSEFFDENPNIMADLHQNNLMLRENTLVVTDPMCERDPEILVDLEQWEEKKYYRYS